MRRSCRLGGVLLVGAWFSVINPWPTIAAWCTTPVDTIAARQVLGDVPVRVLISDNDRYTPDFRSNAEEWRERVGAVVDIIPGKAHYGGRKQVEVLQAALDMISVSLCSANSSPDKSHPA